MSEAVDASAPEPVAATDAVTTTTPAKLVDLFPGIDDKDKAVPKPKDVVFRFGTAGFRTKVYLKKRCARG